MSFICSVNYDKIHSAEIVNPGGRQGRCFCEWRLKLIHDICRVRRKSISERENSFYKDPKATYV